MAQNDAKVKFRNDAEFTIIRKIREKNHRGQTGSRFAKPEVVVYFGLLLV